MSESLSPPPSSTGPQTPGNTSAGSQKIRRRNRIITSCLECRRRKLKCDRAHPCNHCVKAKRDCVFLAPSLDATSKNKLNQFKESVDSLEKNLGRADDGDGTFAGWSVANANGDGRPVTELIPADEKDLEPSPLALADVVYDDDADADNIIDDLGIRFGKVRITERIGGFVRPRFSDELQDTFRSNPSLQMPEELNQAEREAADQTPTGYDSYGEQNLQPSSEYLPPGLGLSFSFAPHGDDVSLLTFLPSHDFADKLLERYWIAVHPIARVVHRSSFNKQYRSFWKDISAGFEPQVSNQAIVFAAQFSASVSLSEAEAQSHFGCAREDMIRTFRSGCEYALSKSNLLKTTRTSTLQALVMYLIPLCRSEISRAHAAIVSMAIRLAECAGMHRDGTQFGLSPIETHVRRMIWYQLCFLDVRVCEAVGPRPTIRKAEFDTQMPLNVDDRELDSLIPPTQDAARFTDMTLSRIRFESNEISRMIWVERPRVEKGETSLTALLRKVEEFRERMMRKWMPILDGNDWVQAFAQNLLQLVVTRARIGILHRYVVSTTQDIPERMTRLVWSSGAKQLELAIEWETSPRFKPFSWYLGAYQQWHVALLFIPLIVSAKTPPPELDTVWQALDYIFEFPKNLSRLEKIRLAFWIARSRLDELQKKRKHRLPTSLEARLGSTRSSTTPERKLGVLPSANPKRRQQSNEMPFPLAQRRGSSFAESTDSSGFAFSSFGTPSNVPPATNVSPVNNMNSQLDGVDWEDFDRLFPREDPGMFDTQAFAQDTKPKDLGSADMPAMTFLPAPSWGQTNQRQWQ